MKGILLLLLTILVALCIINGCEGRRRRWRQRIPNYATMNLRRLRATLNDDIQDEDIENVDSEDGHLDERYVDMNDDDDVMDDIDERNVNDPQEDD